MVLTYVECVFKKSFSYREAPCQASHFEFDSVTRLRYAIIVHVSQVYDLSAL